MEREHLYVDGIKQVHFIGGMVRLDTFVLQPQQGAEPVQADAAQLVMTPQGFLSAFGAMQQLADKLAEAGVLQKNN